MHTTHDSKNRASIESRGAVQSSRTVFLHDAQELDNDLRTRSDQHLSLSGLLGVVHAVERIVQDTGSDHLGGCALNEILKSKIYDLRYLLIQRVSVSLQKPVSVKSALPFWEEKRRVLELIVASGGKAYHGLPSTGAILATRATDGFQKMEDDCTPPATCKAHWEKIFDRETYLERMAGDES